MRLKEGRELTLDLSGGYETKTKTESVGGGKLDKDKVHFQFSGSSVAVHFSSVESVHAQLG